MEPSTQRYIDEQINQITRRLRERFEAIQNGQIPPRARLFRFNAPLASSTWFTYTGSDASTYTGSFVQPDVPRTLQINWGGTWSGGDIELDYIFDGEQLTTKFTASPGAIVHYPDTPITKIVQARKASVGVGTAAFGASYGFGLETDRRPADPFGIGTVDGVAEQTNHIARTDGRVVSFTTAPNGSRVFIVGVNLR